MKRKTLAWLFSLALIVLLIGFVSTWADNGNSSQNIDGCNELNTTGATYTLTSNVSSSGTCFNITAQNITLDCAGYWINYSTGGSDNTYGIYTNQFNTTVKNCNVVDGNYSSTATLRRGIYFSNSDNSTLYRNFAISNNSNAIDVRSDSAYVNLTNNTGISTFNRGIYLSVTRSILVDNLGMSNSTHAFDIGGGSTNSLFINNIGITNTTNGNGIILYFADNNTLINCSGTSKDEGVIIHGSKYNVFIGITAIGVSAGSEGIRIEESNHSLFRDCLNITGDPVEVITTDSLNSTFINCSYNTESVNVEPNYLIRKWYYQAYVNDSIGFSTANVNISAYNTTGQLQFTTITNSSGLIDRQEVIEYVNIGGTRSYYNNYTINASLTGYETESNVFNFTTTQNKIYDLFTLQGEVLQCGTLDAANTVYILTQNVSSNGTCFTIGAENITLDCAGYWINYSINGTDYGRGIYTNQLNTTIKNCNIIDGNITNINANRQGIYFYQSSNGTIDNNTVVSNNSQAVHLRLNSNFNNITNNMFHGFTDIGLDMHTSDNNNITNNLFITDSSIDSAWVIYQSSDNLFVNNTGIGGGYGTYVVGTTSTPSNNNIFINNTAISDVGDAIRLVLGEDNLFINQIAISSSPGDYAIIIDDVNNTKFIDCTNITASPTQVYIHTGTSLNNSFINCSYASEWIREGETELIRKWYYQAYTNYSNGTAVAGANITAYNSIGEIQFNALTNSSGYIDRQEIIDYVNAGGTRYDYNNYAINATLLDYDVDTNSFNFSILQNKLDDIFTLTGGPDITSPNYSFVNHNTTSSNKFSLFSIYVVDNYLLHPNGQYIFSTNNTGIWINDSAVNFTSTPSWANVTKTLNSSVGMVVGYRWYFNDSAGNTNSTPEYVFVTTESSLFPYFTLVPENSYFFYANQSLGVYFDATDETEFGYFSVNDTRFLINQSGYLSNVASLAAGNYFVNITINNSLGNINWTIYHIQINKSVSEVYLYANNLRSNVTLSNGSVIWLNGTLQSGVGVINLYYNGTLINFGSSPIYNLTQFNNVGFYNITVIYPGNENYTSSYETWWVNSTNLSLYNPTHFVVNHTSVAEFENIPNYWIEQAKKLTLHYAHTSHGEQIIQGSEYIESSVNFKYNVAVRVASTEGLPVDTTALRIYDGNPPETYIAPEDYWDNVTASNALTRTTAVADTGNYNISMWSWCGQQSDNSIEQVELYLNNMYWLQQQYPNMTFILMTGHLASQNNEYVYSNLMRDTLKRNNDMVRNFAIEYNMTLFDFADLDGHNGTGYCYTNDYHAAYNNTIVECEWPSSPSFECAHSEGANCERKANAFWVMMAKIAGWNGQNNTAPVTSLSLPSNYSSLSPGQINFQCNLTDDYDLKNTTLYIWNSTGNLISSNLSANISGTSNSTNINYTLNNDGNYFWNCLTYDGDSVASFSLANNTLIITGSPDTTPPYYELVVHNSTLENYLVLFSIYINDNSELNPNGQYIFSTNNTGVWVNDSAVNFTSTPSWANVTKTLNSSVGMVVGYKWYFNDSAGNTNSTEIYTFIITSDSIPGENSCGTLASANTVYTLTGNVSSNGTCFTIGADNITLDCNGYWINYSINGSSNSLGVYTNQFNTTIKNCNIFDGNMSSTYSSRQGILFYGENLGKAYNNFISVNNSPAIYLYNSDYCNITLNILNSYNDNGVILESSSNNILENNNVLESYWSGLTLNYNSENNLIKGNNLSSYTLGLGIHSLNNTIINNFVESLGESTAFYVLGSNSSIENNTGISAGSYALHIRNSNNSLIVNNNFTSSTGNLVVYFYNTSNNIFSNNTLISGDYEGNLIRFNETSMNNLLYWNNFTKTSGYFVDNNHNSNNFNTTNNGISQGNYYYNITSLDIFDSNGDSWGDTGSDYPLNSTSWPIKWNNLGADFGPYTTREYSDVYSPIIGFEEPPTPENGLTVNSSTQTIIANISDDSEGDTSSWIDFDRSLIGYWSMDYYNTTGIFDNSSYNNFGIFNGNLSVSNITNGVRGNALLFDGIDNSLTIDPINFSNTNKISVSFWFNPSSVPTSGNDMLLEMSFNMVIYQDSFFINLQNDGNISAALNGDTGYSQWYSSTKLTSGNWYNVVVVFDKSLSVNETKIYIDGELDGVPSETFNSDNTNNFGNRNLYIGSRGSTTEFVNGSFDEVIIFNRSLSETEISALYNSQSNKFNVTFINLSEGKHNYTVYAIDESGNYNTSGERYFTFEEQVVGENSCGTLDSANTVYTLTGNVSSNGTCFTITQPNITLDCNGYWINYSINGSANTYGVYSNQFNTTVKNCNVVDGSNWTTGIGIERYGIYFNENDNSTLVNNFVNVSNSRAIYILGDSYFNSIINNTGNGYSEVGIYAVSLYFSLFINNTFISNSYPGMDLGSGSYNNTFINNTFISNSSSGMLIYGAHNNSLTNCTITSNNSHSLVIYYSQFNVIVDSIIQALSVGHSAIEISGSTNKTLFENVNLSSVSLDIYSDADSLDNEFVNCFYNINKESIHDTSRIIRKWYYQAYTNYSNGTDVLGVNISAYNSMGDLQFSALSNSSGLINRQEVVEYINTGGTRSYYNNYTINASLEGYLTESNVFNFTVTQNNLDDWFTLTESGTPGENACGTLDSAGTTYTLTSNVSSQGTCFTITQPNITLDCNGYWINYSTGGNANTHGVYSNQFNTTIKNCNIVQGNWSVIGGNSSRWGIYLYYSNNSKIYNNYINTSRAYGMNIDGCYYGEIINNYGISNPSVPLVLNNCLNMNLINNTFLSEEEEGLYLLRSNNTLIQNNIVQGKLSAIELYSSINNTLIENIANSSTIALYIGGSNHSLINNTATGKTGSGIYVGSYNILINNTGKSNSSYGIYLYSGSNNNLTLNNGISNFSYGIYLGSSSNNNLTNNIGYSESYRAIGIYTNSNNNTLLNNNFTSSSGRGIYISSSHNNNLTDNNVETGHDSIWINDFSSNNNLINNTFISNGAIAIILSVANNNTFINNTGITNANSNEATWIYSSLNNIFISHVSKGVSTGSTGLSIQISNNTLIKDCINISGLSFDVDIWSSSLNTTFVNCSYLNNKEYVSASSNLIRKWYYQAYTNYSNGTEASGVNVSAYNSTGDLQFSALTNSSGLIERQEVVEYVNTGGTRSYYNNYTINASLDGYTTDSNTFNFTVTQNKLDDWFTLEEAGTPGENACGTLDVAGTTYTLTSNVSSNGTCFTITQPNITLDCNGYWINYSINGTESTYGIYTNQFNTTVKNCNVVDGNYSSTATLRRGIYFSNSDNSTLYRNFAISNNSNAIDVRDDSAYVNLTNNTGISTFNRGIYLSVTRSILVDNLGMSNSSHAFDIGGGSTNSLFINDIGITNTTNGNGIILYFADNNTLINCSGTSQDEGIIVYGSKYNALIGITAIGVSAGSEGIRIENSNHSLFRDCNNITGDSVDVITTDSLNSTFINCSYNTESVNVEPNYLIRKWYYQAYTNYSNGTEASGVNITAYNITGDLQFSVLSNSSGDIERQEVTEYVNTGGTRSYYNNYTINASLDGYGTESNVFNFTVTQNKIDDWFTLEEEGTPGEDSCGTLDFSNTVYTLTGNVSSSGTCFTIGAENITLDCNGYSINYSLSEFGYGVSVTDYNNLTVRNCNIMGGTTSLTHGILLQNSNNAEIYNNNITVFGSISDCISIYTSNYTSISNNTLNDFGESGHAIYSRTGSYNNVSNSIFYAYLNSSGIYLEYGSHNWSIFDLEMFIEEGRGIVVNDTSDETLLMNNKITSNNFGRGIIVDSSFNELLDLNLLCNSSDCLIVSGDSNSIINSSFYSDSGYSVNLTEGENNSFIDNTFSGAGVNGSLLTISDLAGNNLFYWNNFTSTEGYYINNSNSSNKFNTTILGIPQGNYYSDLFYKIIYDSNEDGWGDSGSDYPLNSSNWVEKWIGFGSDYAPATTRQEDLISPIYNLVSRSSKIAGEVCNFRINITDNYLLDPNGQYIFSTNNTGVWVNDTPVNFTSNPSLSYTPKTLNSSVDVVVGYRWYFKDFAGNRNSTKIYTLITEEEEEDDGGGGGGSGSSDEDDVIILRPSYKQVQEGYETAVSKGYLIQFNLSDKGQYLAEIKDVNRFIGIANLSINSTNYSVELNKSIKINLNNDSYYDLEASLLMITFFNSSRMLFKEIHENISSSTNPGVNETSLGNRTVVDFFGNYDNNKSEKFLYFIVVGIIVVLMALVSFFIFLKFKKTPTPPPSASPI